MTRSANEVMSLAAKAARGAGAPPGQAAEFGAAAVCHLIAGRDASLLRAALDALPAGPILSLPLSMARILETNEDGVASGVISSDGGVDLCQSYAEALPFVHTARVTVDELTLRIETGVPANRRVVARVELPDTLATWMAELAARTFVPESEASRLAGAGAGLTDND